MRIDGFPMPGVGNMEALSAVPETEGPAEGETYHVRVIFNNGEGSVHLKTDEGTMIRAQLQEGVDLPEGSEATVTVTDASDGVVYMSLSGRTGTRAAGQPEPGSVAALAKNPEFAELAVKLQALKLPVTEETILAMRDLLNTEPGMTLEKAAFLAANAVPAEEPLMAAADSLISGEFKLADTLRGLMEKLDSAVQLPDAPAETAILQDGGADGVRSEPSLTGFLTALLEGEPGVQQVQVPVAGEVAVSQESVPAAGEVAVPQEPVPVAGEVAVPQESVPVAGEAAVPQEPVPATGEAVVPQEPGPITGEAAVPQEPGPVVGEAVVPQEPVSVAGEAVVPQEPGPVVGEAVVPQEPVSVAGEAAVPQESVSATGEAVVPQGDSPVSPQRELFSLLTKMPAFDGVPEENLEALKSALLEIAGEIANAETAENQDPAEKLKAMLDGVFAKVGEGGETGKLLKKAKEELLLRLNLFEEQLTGSNVSGKAAMAAETQKLVDHVKLIDNISQFAYMQIPIEINDEQKTAELYIFKRKQKGKIDPDNVNILLALDMTNMGRLESLINIRGKEVSLRVETTTEEAGRFIKGGTVKLHKLLSEIGYKLTEIKAAPLKEEASVEKAFLTLFERGPSGRSGIDFHI